MPWEARSPGGSPSRCGTDGPWCWPSGWVTLLAGSYAWRELGFNTNPNDLFDRDLPFQQMIRRFEAHFPQLTDSLLIVVDGEDPLAVRDRLGCAGERARGARRALHARLLPGRGGVLRGARTPVREPRAARRLHRAAGRAPAADRCARARSVRRDAVARAPAGPAPGAAGRGAGGTHARGARPLPRRRHPRVRGAPALRRLGGDPARGDGLRPGHPARDRG